MTTHDPLCPQPSYPKGHPCKPCDLIAKVRADELAKVSMAINRRMLARAVVANDHHALTERDVWLLAADIARNWTEREDKPCSEC